MRYEYANLAIFSIIFGFLLLLYWILVTFWGVCWIPYTYPSASLIDIFLHYCIHYGYAISTLLLFFGGVGVKREFELRSFERKFRNSQQLAKKRNRRGRHSR